MESLGYTNYNGIMTSCEGMAKQYVIYHELMDRNDTVCLHYIYFILFVSKQ